MGNENSQQVKLGESIENDINVTWKKSEKEAPFPARDGHCAASVGNKVYFFGGVISVDADGYETNELLSFDVENGSWSKVVTKGDTPPARFAATMSAVGTSLFLFGGLSQDSGWFDDVHKFDTESKTWSVVQVEGEAPSPRDKLSSTIIEKDIYIFGGFGPLAEDDLEEDDDEEEEQDGTPQDQEAAQFGWFDDLYVFNTATNTWSNPMQMNLQKPTPRAAMAMCAVDNYICIFGGRDSEARRNDTHIFNTVSRKWESLSISGRLPEPRSFHTATTVGKRVVVLGGRGTANQHFDDFNIFDIETMQWLQPVVQGTKPAARGVHTATVVGDQLVVFGGSSEFNPGMNQCLKYFNDLHHVSMKEIMSGAPKPAASAVSSIKGETKPGPAGDCASQAGSSCRPTETKSSSKREDEGPSPKKSKLESEKS